MVRQIVTAIISSQLNPNNHTKTTVKKKKQFPQASTTAGTSNVANRSQGVREPTLNTSAFQMHTKSLEAARVCNKRKRKANRFLPPPKRLAQKSGRPSRSATPAARPSSDSCRWALNQIGGNKPIDRVQNR